MPDFCASAAARPTSAGQSAHERGQKPPERCAASRKNLFRRPRVAPNGFSAPPRTGRWRGCGERLHVGRRQRLPGGGIFAAVERTLHGARDPRARIVQCRSNVRSSCTA